MISSQDVLWEDLDMAHSKAHHAVEMLQALIQNVRDGQLDSPTRRDSQRLTRLLVIADLLCNELTTWSDEHGLQDLNVAVSAARANGNGKNGTH
jgi:hypothetical protein